MVAASSLSMIAVCGLLTAIAVRNSFGPADLSVPIDGIVSCPLTTQGNRQTKHSSSARTYLHILSLCCSVIFSKVCPYERVLVDMWHSAALAVGSIMNQKWTQNNGVYVGQFCSIQGELCWIFRFRNTGWIKHRCNQTSLRCRHGHLCPSKRPDHDSESIHLHETRSLRSTHFWYSS